MIESARTLSRISRGSGQSGSVIAVWKMVQRRWLSIRASRNDLPLSSALAATTSRREASDSAQASVLRGSFAAGWLT